MHTYIETDLSCRDCLHSIWKTLEKAVVATQPIDATLVISEVFMPIIPLDLAAA